MIKKLVNIIYSDAILALTKILRPNYWSAMQCRALPDFILSPQESIAELLSGKVLR